MKHLRRIPVFALAFALAVACFAGDYLDRFPPWDAWSLVSFNAGDATDKSQAAATPTVGSGATATGRAFDYDGTSNAVISYADTDALDTVPLTVCFWVYIDTYTSYRQFVGKMTQTGSGDGYRGWHVYHGGGISRGLSFGRTENNASKFRQYWTAVGELTTATWYHCAVTCSDLNSAPVLYINGVSKSLSSATAGTVTTIATTEPLRIGGKGGPDFTAYYDGKIDNVHIFSTAKTADEIAAIYASEVGETR